MVNPKDVRKANADLIRQIQKRIFSMMPNDKKMRKALFFAGTQILNQTKINIRTPSLTGSGKLKPLIDRGFLRNSIQMLVLKANENGGELAVGSFGIPYARLHEYGYQGPFQIPAHQRRITQDFGRKIDPKVVNVKAHIANRRYPPRPYLTPAFEVSREYVNRVIRTVLYPGPINE